MGWSTKYQLPFKNRHGVDFSVNILAKDYVGTITQLVGASDPFILNYQSGDDSIINPIRASECTINFFNDGNAPLTDFYSDDDEMFKIEFYNDTTPELLWAGFVVQDSCSERFADPSYVVQLKGTDNLGLLKDVSFDEAWHEIGPKTLYESNTSDVTISTLNTFTVTLPIIVTSQDVTLMDILFYDSVYYTITTASYNSSTNVLIVHILETFPANGTFTSKYWEIYTQTSLEQKLALFDFIKIALQKTGIAIPSGVTLPVYIYCNLYENTEFDRSTYPLVETFSQTHVDSRMFMDDQGVWQSCYDVVEQILFAFNASLYQSGGKWIIIRWPELRLFPPLNQIDGTSYDINFSNPAAIHLFPNQTISHDTDTEFIGADATRSILRPFKTVKFTYKYELPSELIKNINLLQEGDLINHYTLSGLDYKEYELLYWTPINLSNPNHPSNIYLRVISKPITGTSDVEEVDRYIYFESSGVNSYGGPWLQSSSLYIDAGDRVNVSFSFRTSNSNVGPANLVFTFQTDTGTSQYKINWNNGAHPLDGSWATNGGAIFQWTSAQDIQNWTTFSVESLGCPVSGYFSIMLEGADNNYGGETYYKDFNIEYLPLINNSLKIEGQFHLQEEDINIKNKLEADIKLDDSPKRAFKGALFTSALTGGDYFTLTQLWHRGSSTEIKKLGRITTEEREQMQSTPRTIIEGSLNYTDPFISVLNVMQIDTLPGLNFIFGVTEFNFMEAIFTATLWEIYEDGEADIPATGYTFNYIYKLS